MNEVLFAVTLVISVIVIAWCAGISRNWDK